MDNIIVDKEYCASSFLMYRTLHTVDGCCRCFDTKYPPNLWKRNMNRIGIHNSDDLLKYFEKRVRGICNGKKVALALSGGIDSALLAKFMPKGLIAYTFKCIVPGIEVFDETAQARRYAEECGLEHRIIEVYWDDFEKYAPALMRHKGAPIHSIEVQIYKAALKAKEDGCDAIIFGESSDLNYGGLSGLLSKDWTVGEFINRYAYVKPYEVLKNFRMITAPIVMYEKDGYVDVHEFDRGFFMDEAMGSYSNACELADIKLYTPYAETYYAEELDINRIRSGENKYIVREAFDTMYRHWYIPDKTPMPRPMNEWFADWKGPIRHEFWPHCTNNMSGDQKWLVWALEKFMNILEGKNE